MKRIIFTLTLVVLACVVNVNAQAPRPLLGKSVTGVNATSNVAINVSLDFVFVLSGQILGDPGSTPVSVSAISNGGGFEATINQTSHRYRMELPAGTYSLSISFVRSSGSASTSFTFTDPTQVTVSGDTDRDISLPAVTTFSVTGNISSLSMLAVSKSVAFSSASVTGFAEVITSSSLDTNGNYSALLPNGTFSSNLSQLEFSTSGITTFDSSLTPITVNGTTTANLTAPTISTNQLSGTVSFTGSSAIPANALLEAVDATGPPPPQTTSSSSESLASTGAYSFVLGTGDKYKVSSFVSVQLLPPPAPLGSFTPPDPNQSPNPLTADTVRNITYPAIPGSAVPFTISGRVTTTASGAPVPNATVSAVSTTLSVAPDTSFAQFATTDANGAYSLVVPAGTYGLFVEPGPAAAGDLDGDGLADISVFRPSNGTWFTISSKNSSNFIITQWGATGDLTVPGDYDGDRKTDIAVFRPSNGTWYLVPSSNPGAPIVKQWGAPGDIPVPGDYDGDGKIDFAVFRPSNGFWYIIPSSNPSAPIIKQWGATGDLPVAGDYDGDGKTDIAVFRPSNGVWYIIPTGNPSAPIVQQWGTEGDVPVPADYDGDHIADIAVWRPSNGTWFIIPSGTPTSFTATQWGASSDLPVQKNIGQ